MKDDFRARFLATRRARSAEEIAHARSLVRAAVLERAEARGWRRVAAYEPMRTEPGSIELLNELAARSTVIVPVLLPDKDLAWAVWPMTDGPLDPTAVRDVDAVLVPALAVDRTGVRLGRGGGSYDRALTRVRAGVPVAALLYDGELVDSLPSDPWDVRVTAVVTPSGWREL